MNAFDCLLLIDDDKIATFINSSLLKKLNLSDDIVTANDGKVGFEKLIQIKENKSDCPTLIFLDVNMPVMNGFEFMEAFNAAHIEGKEQIKIVVLTSSENEQDIDKMASLGIQHYLTKPLTEQKVRNLIDEIV